jgi:hypothetical protein
VSPRVKGTELTGGVFLSMSRREEGRRRLTSGTRSSVTTRRGSSARTASARAELERAGLRAEFRPLAAVFFLFLFMQFLIYI